MRETEHGTLEAWAAVTPAVCVIHCLSAPLLATFAPALAATPAFERVFMALALILSVPALWSGRRHHARLSPLLLASAGSGLWLAHLLLDVPTLVVGGLVLSAALLWNRGLRLRGRNCDCPVCDPEE